MHIRQHTGENSLRTFSCTVCDSCSCYFNTPAHIGYKKIRCSLFVLVAKLMFLLPPPRGYVFVLVKYVYLTGNLVGISNTRHGRPKCNKL